MRSTAGRTGGPHSVSQSDVRPLSFHTDRSPTTWWQDPGYYVRLFRPIGWHPRVEIRQRDALFHADRDIVFSVVRALPWLGHQASHDSYTEMDHLHPQELRFLSSILLCEKRNDAPMRLYPHFEFNPRISRKRMDLRDVEVAKAVKRLIFETVNRPGQNVWKIDGLEDFWGKYDLVEAEHFNFDRQTTYWKRVSAKDYTLLRGIGALIKSDMLACHHEFYEEAIIVSFIALEASLHLVLRALECEGLDQPGPREAAMWLYENFDKPFGLDQPTVEKYFEDFYDRRIMTLHPISRFGENLYAPLMHDDYYHLRKSLREIFAYLVVGSHSLDYYDDLKIRQGGGKQ